MGYVLDSMRSTVSEFGQNLLHKQLQSHSFFLSFHIPEEKLLHVRAVNDSLVKVNDELRLKFFDSPPSGISYSAENMTNCVTRMYIVVSFEAPNEIPKKAAL